MKSTENREKSKNIKEISLVIGFKKIRISCAYTNLYHQCYDYFSEFESPDISVSVTLDEIYEEARHKSLLNKAIDYANDKICTEFISTESALVYRKIADSLIDYHLLLLHGAAITVDNKGYIFTAPSGTGKTTHIKNWLKVIPGTYVVNGDKPLIDVKNKLIFGTPWCGKEKMNTNTFVPLSGIVSLVRGDDNSIMPISFSEMLPVYLQQIYIPDERIKAIKAYKLIDYLKDIPCYRLICNMNDESAIVSHQGLCKNNYS